MIESGQVILGVDQLLRETEVAVGSPLAVIDPVGITVAAVVELVDWQHNNSVLVILVNSALGRWKLPP